jgi:hypothetical protein
MITAAADRKKQSSPSSIYCERKEAGMKRFLLMVIMIPALWIPAPGRIVIVPPPQPCEIHIAPPRQPGHVGILLLRETQWTVEADKEAETPDAEGNRE